MSDTQVAKTETELKIEALKAQLAAIESKRRAEERDTKSAVAGQILDHMKANNLSLEDLTYHHAKRSAKFTDGNGNFWSGRGKQPDWLASAVKGGASLDSFRIAGTEQADTGTDEA